jgi:hypothetical protein
MHTRRFGRKLKLPSTVAIKHAILRLMVQDELKVQAPAAKAEEVSLLTAAAPLNTIATPLAQFS